MEKALDSAAFVGTAGEGVPGAVGWPVGVVEWDCHGLEGVYGRLEHIGAGCEEHYGFAFRQVVLGVCDCLCRGSEVLVDGPDLSLLVSGVVFDWGPAWGGVDPVEGVVMDQLGEPV